MSMLNSHKSIRLGNSSFGSSAKVGGLANTSFGSQKFSSVTKNISAKSVMKEGLN